MRKKSSTDEKKPLIFDINIIIIFHVERSFQDYREKMLGNQKEIMIHSFMKH